MQLGPRAWVLGARCLRPATLRPPTIPTPALLWSRWARSLVLASAPLLRPPTCLALASRAASNRLSSRLVRNLTPRVRKTYSTESKPSIYERLKQLVKDYWYIALPVHTLNCACWFGAIYAAIAGGLDVVSWLEWARIPSSLIDKVRHSPGLGNLALAILVYKLATPPRYLVSISLTGLAIRVCAARGLITSSQAMRQAHGFAITRRAHYVAKYESRREDWRKAWHAHRERLQETYRHRMRRFRK